MTRQGAGRGPSQVAPRRAPVNRRRARALATRVIPPTNDSFRKAFAMNKILAALVASAFAIGGAQAATTGTAEAAPRGDGTAKTTQSQKSDKSHAKSSKTHHKSSTDKSHKDKGAADKTAKPAT